MARTISTRTPCRSLVLRALLALVLLPALLGTPAAARQASEAVPETVTIDQLALRVDAGGAVTTAALAAPREGALRAMQDALDLVVGASPDAPLLIRFTTTLPDDSGWQPVSDLAVLAPDATEAVVRLDAFLALSDTDARNLLRYLAARHWLASAADGALPAPLADGFARYLEEPVLARQARQASLAQQAWLDGDLPGWAALLADPDATAGLDPDAAAAGRVAVAAFLVERYGTGMIADLTARFAADPDADPAAVVSEATGQPAERLDAAWEDFITLWFAGGWRANAFAALDLGPAEDLFARGAYEAAVDRANQTLQVTAALDDPIASAEAEMLVAQGSVGMQAEALMRDAEAALRAFEYERARTLLDRAVDQYDLLPEDHRPDSLIASWRETADTGLAAIAQLQDAIATQDDWFALRQSREDAVAAGSAFARLGDTERLALADEVVADLDDRFLRLVFALGAAILVLAGWLAVWSWHRSPGRIRWPGLRDLAHEGGLR